MASITSARAAVPTRTDAAINCKSGSAIPSGTADDGARFWVNDDLLVQRAYSRGTGEMRGQMRMESGHRVNVRLDFVPQTGNASVKLEWASVSQAKQVVPTNRLHKTTGLPNGGSVIREVWHGLPGASISTMTLNANCPNKPASREFFDFV